MVNEIKHTKGEVELTDDQYIELAMEMERAMVRKILEECKILNNYHERTDKFSVGFTTAIEEFEYRINEKWLERPCKEPEAA